MLVMDSMLKQQSRLGSERDRVESGQLNNQTDSSNHFLYGS